MKKDSFWRSKDHENVARLRGLIYESVNVLKKAQSKIVSETDTEDLDIADHIEELVALLDATKDE